MGITVYQNQQQGARPTRGKKDFATMIQKTPTMETINQMAVIFQGMWDLMVYSRSFVSISMKRAQKKDAHGQLGNTVYTKKEKDARLA